MMRKMRSGPKQHWSGLALFLGLLLSIMWVGPVVRAEEAGWRGQVESMPAGGGSGEWIVRGRLFVATNATEFRPENGGFAVGVCVELKYAGTTPPFQAIKIVSKRSDECGNNATPTLSRTPEASESPMPAGEQESAGRVNRMPLGLIGEWIIGGVPYRTTVNTEFDFEEGPVVIGACVKLHYATANRPFVIRELKTTEAEDCSGVAPTGVPTMPPPNTAKVKALIDSMPEKGLMGIWIIGGNEYQVAPGARLRQEGGPFTVDACVEVDYVVDTTPRKVHKLETERSHDCTEASTPVATPTLVPTAPIAIPGEEFEVYGRVQILPSGLIGEWMVNGVKYLATSSTEFDQEHGAFAVGRCVKIHAINTTSPATMTEVENTRGFHCTPADDQQSQGQGVLFGKIQSFPKGLIGEWNVGGMTFTADETTRFNQNQGLFDDGVTVKVRFVVNANQINHANEIEVKFANDEHGHDDDGNGAFEGAEGHAFGTIDAMPPAGLIGKWVIGGIPYTVTAQSRIMEAPSNFKLGANVRVKYYTNEDEERIVRKLKTTNEESGADDASHFTLFAFVDQAPPSGFVGEWVFDHIGFFATLQTQFQEEHGVLALGAYVKVEYFIQDGRKVIHELETQVPPGAGDDLNIGAIESTGDGIAAASAHGTTWVIGGKSYMVTPATDLNDLQSELTVGSTALVNSYTAADGAQVATQIAGITLNNRLYLPMVNR